MRSVSGERAQVKAGEREGGSRVMNLALGGWWRLCHRVQLEHLVQLKHLEHPVHLLHVVHHLTMYCKCTLCLLALLSQTWVLNMHQGKNITCGKFFLFLCRKMYIELDS